MAQGEGPVLGKTVTGPVARIENRPGKLLTPATANMLLGDTAGPPDRRATEVGKWTVFNSYLEKNSPK